jgi:hypothetical protein
MLKLANNIVVDDSQQCTFFVRLCSFAGKETMKSIGALESLAHWDATWDKRVCSQDKPQYGYD